MTTTENTTPLSNNKITRRRMIKSVSTSLAATMVGMSAPAFANSDDNEKWQSDQDTKDAGVAGLVGLPLAAVHIDRAISAMADPVIRGHWSVTIHSGQPDQYWAFRQEFNEVARTISLHKRTAAAFTAAVEREEDIQQELWNNPRFDRRPCVQYGNLLSGRLEDGTDERKPLYAFTQAELDVLCEQECHSRRAIWGQVGMDKTKARYADLKAKLARQIRRKKRMEQKAGLPVAVRATRAASREEERAAIAVVLATPRNAAERQEKRRYMRGKTCFKADWWDAHSLMSALRANVEMRGV